MNPAVESQTQYHQAGKESLAAGSRERVLCYKSQGAESLLPAQMACTE